MTKRSVHSTGSTLVARLVLNPLNAFVSWDEYAPTTGYRSSHEPSREPSRGRHSKGCAPYSYRLPASGRADRRIWVRCQQSGRSQFRNWLSHYRALSHNRYPLRPNRPNQRKAKAVSEEQARWVPRADPEI